MVNTIKGNLLEAIEDAIGQGCNCRKTMGSGVAKAIRDKWPEVYEADLQFNTEYPEDRIGRFSFYSTGQKRIYNIYTQIDYLPRGIDHFQYEGFRLGLGRVLNHMAETGLKTLALPKIGSGLCGGRWSDILKIIESVSEEHGVDITIYEV